MSMFRVGLELDVAKHHVFNVSTDTTMFAAK